MAINITTTITKDRNTIEPGAGFPVDPTSVAGVQPVGQTGYTLVFSDEFNGSTLDLTKWDYAYPNWPRFTSQSPGGRFTNTNNINCFAASQVSLTGGSCILTAQNVSTITGLPYTSGMIQSIPSFTPYLGYAETKLRIASFPTDLWPASWMSCSDYDTWPPEIDYMEAGLTGTGINLNNVYLPSTNYKGSKTGIDFSVWHTFACSWTATGVTFYMDGVQTNTTTLTPATHQYLLVDLAVQAGATFTSATMEIDYVRYWQ